MNNNKKHNYVKTHKNGKTISINGEDPFIEILKTAGYITTDNIPKHLINDLHEMVEKKNFIMIPNILKKINSEKY